MGWVTLAIFIGIVVLSIYACCKVSGDCSREEEKRQ